MDIGGKVNNEKLLAAIENMKADNNPETREAFIDSLQEAKFLVPAVFEPKPEKNAQGKIVSAKKMKVHFKVLTSQKKENVFPCFTDNEIFSRGVQDVETEQAVLTYRELVPLVLNSKGAMAGFVINPYTDNVPVTAALIEGIEKSKKNGISKQVMKPNSTVRLRTPAYQPIDMLNAAKEFFRSSPNVEAAYLQMMEKEDGEDEYLITIDFTGDEKTLFADLMPIVRQYSFGIPVALTNVHNLLGEKVVENAEPFYKKDSQG